jgi:hypothetical protein
LQVQSDEWFILDDDRVGRNLRGDILTGILEQ